MTASSETNSIALAPGFSDPVHDAQSCFRALMLALSRPGTLQPYRPDAALDGAPLPVALAAAALTLVDYDTPVWLDAALASSPAVGSWLRFHTGAPLVENPAEAAFALVANPATLMSLHNFAQGSLEYPDRSTTLIFACDTLEGSAPVILEGPGIKDRQLFSPSPLPPAFWQQIKANQKQFPRGVDVIFACRDGFAGLPRSTTVKSGEA